MAYSPLKARLIREIGTRAWLRIYWDAYEREYEGKNTCPNCLGSGKPGYHDARVLVARSPDLEDWSLGGEFENYPEAFWPQKCDHCKAPLIEGPDIVATKQMLHTRLYNTESGEPEPGDLYYAAWFHVGEDKRCLYWDNCKNPHLIAVLPNKQLWDIDSRARNCTCPDDRTHRCWVRRGELPVITVGKDGPSCSAGAGSIQAGDYHGYLVEGSFTGQ